MLKYRLRLTYFIRKGIYNPPQSASVSRNKSYNEVRIVAKQRVAQSRGYCIYYSNLLKTKE
jgi:hypothetical protein